MKYLAALAVLSACAPGSVDRGDPMPSLDAASHSESSPREPSATPADFPSISGDADTPDADSPIALDYALQVAPGAEAVVQGGPVLQIPSDTWISGWSAKMQYIHHLGVLALAPGETSNRLVFTALTADFNQRVPVAGGALYLKAGTSLSLNAHHINTTTETVVAKAHIELRVASSHTVEVFNNYVDTVHISAPLGATTRVSFSCDVPPDVRFVSIIGHSHSHNVLETATTDGVEVYRSTDWNDPAIVLLDKPLAPKVISWACDVANTGGMTIGYGQRRDMDEMCQLYLLSLGRDWHCIK